MLKSRILEQVMVRIFIFTVLLSLNARAANVVDGVAALRPREIPIPGLKFKSMQFPIRYQGVRGGSVPVVEVEGRFDRPLWSLRFHDHPVELDHGRFRITFPVVNADRNLTIDATVYGPFGTVESESLEFQVMELPR